MGSAGEQLKKDPLGFVANVALNGSTGGLLGYENGQIGKGVTTRGADEAIGEITGRNLARDEVAAGKAKVAAEDAQRQVDLANQLERDRVNDINASMSASASRRTIAARNSGGASALAATMGSDEKDFLGL